MERMTPADEARELRAKQATLRMLARDADRARTLTVERDTLENLIRDTLENLIKVAK